MGDFQFPIEIFLKLFFSMCVCLFFDYLYHTPLSNIIPRIAYISYFFIIIFFLFYFLIDLTVEFLISSTLT